MEREGGRGRLDEGRRNARSERRVWSEGTGGREETGRAGSGRRGVEENR